MLPHLADAPEKEARRGKRRETQKQVWLFLAQQIVDGHLHECTQFTMRINAEIIQLLHHRS
jgi:hypothetical protein